MKITIRKAIEKDFFEILSLIKELATFEKAPEKVTNTVEQMKKIFFNALLLRPKKKKLLE